MYSPEIAKIILKEANMHIEKINSEIFFVDYEPGDSTHYSFLVYRDGPDNFTIAPRRNTFKYPQRLNVYADFHPSEKRIQHLAKEYNCNPWTVTAVIETCEAIHAKY
jgi:hypothetical protein